MKRALMIMALLFLSGTVNAQIQEAGTFDEKTGVLKLDTAKEITISDKYEMPIKISGTLDTKVPQVMKAGEGKAYRFRIQTDKHMTETYIDSLGVEQTRDSAYWLEDIIDGPYAELYSDHISITQYSGKTVEYKGKYHFYVIDEKYARHSPRVLYFKADGSDAGSGTEEAPYQTHALFNRLTTAALAGGDSAKFNGGDYFGACQRDTCMIMPVSGAADSAVVVTSYGTGRATFTGAAPASVFAPGTGWFPTNDVPDSSGLERTATNYGAHLDSAGTGADTLGYDFDGVDDYVDTGSDFIGTGDVTIAFWVFPRSEGMGNLVNNNSGTFTTKFQLRIGSNNTILLYVNENPAVSTNDAFVLNAWNHIIVTCDTAGNTCRFFSNGVYATDDSVSSTRAAGARNVIIGNREARDAGFDGLIKDMVFLNFVVDGAQADSLFKGTLAALRDSTKNTAFYRFGAASAWSLTNPLYAIYCGTAADSSYAVWSQGVLGTRRMSRALLLAGAVPSASVKPWSLSYNGEYPAKSLTTTGNTNDYMLLKYYEAADTSGVSRSKNYCAVITSKNYITLSNLSFKFGTGILPSISKPGNIFLSGTSGNVTIQNCLIDSVAISGRGIAVGATGGNNVIKYNIFHGSLMTGIQFTQPVEIYNNIFDKVLLGILVGNNTSIIKNNLFYSVPSFIYTTSILTSFVGSNNLYYDTSYSNRWTYNSINYISLAAWQTATGQDANSLTGWPKFVGQIDSTSAITDYHLQPTSKAIDAGVDVGLTTDYDGHPILNTPDIGALEYPQFSITVTAGVHGSISPPTAWYDSGTASQTFTITPDAGYTIDTLYVDGAVIWRAANALSYTFSAIDTSHTIQAAFRLPAVWYVTQSGGAVTKTGASYATSMSKSTFNSKQFSPGDSIYLCGTFEGSEASAYITNGFLGAPSKQIVVSGGYAAAPGILDGNNIATYGYGRPNVNYGYYTLEYLEIKNYVTGGITNAPSDPTGAVGHMIFQYNNIHDIADSTASSAIRFNAPDCKALHNTIDGVGDDAIWFCGNNAEVAYNTISNVALYDTTETGGGDNIQHGQQADSNIWIHHNYLTHGAWQKQVIMVEESTNGVIEYNTCIGGTHGINDFNCTGDTLRYNKIYDTVGSSAISVDNSSVSIYGNVISGVYEGIIVSYSNVHTANIYNNTLYDIDSFGLKTSTANTASTINHKNNIYSTVDSCFAIYAVNTTLILNSDNNLYYIGHATKQFYYSTYHASLAAFIATDAKDSASVASDPKFVSASSLTLKGSSKAINAGASLGFTHDIDGNAIKGIPDIGAYEFMGSTSTSDGISNEIKNEITNEISNRIR